MTAIWMQRIPHDRGMTGGYRSASLIIFSAGCWPSRAAARKDERRSGLPLIHLT
ncbi:hypothetical protein [Agrobacterium cavarae]